MTLTTRPLRRPSGARVPDGYIIESLVRGLAVLRAFTEESPSLSVSELAHHIGVTKTTIVRIVTTLEVLGYLRLDPATRRYHLSWRVLELGYSALENMDIVQRAHPHLEQLSVLTGETVNLSVLDGTEIVYVDRVHTRQILSISLHIGSRLPAYCTSMGKAILASISEADALKVIRASALVPRARGTIVTETGLLADLERTRVLGYAVNDEELVDGLRSVAAPVCDRTGRAVAAVNMSLPAARCSPEELRTTFAPHVVETASNISAMLGFRAPALVVGGSPGHGDGAV